MKILFVTGGSPLPPTSGVNQRTNLLASALAAVGPTDLVIVSAYVALDSKTEGILRKQFGFLGLLRPVKRRFLSLITRAVGNFDLSFLRHDPAIGQRIRTLVAEGNYDLVVFRYARSAIASDAVSLPVPFMLDADDLDTQTFRVRMELATGLTRLRRRIALALVHRAVTPFLSKAAHIWVASEADLELLNQTQASVLPNIPFDLPTTPQEPVASNSMHCAIVASCQHRPNVEGIDKFVLSSWSEIRHACPEATLRIAGFGMTDQQKQRWDAIPGVTPLGEVADLATVYDWADLALVPIEEGGGTKIKVLEALGYGCPVVAMDHAARGLERLGGDTDSGLLRAVDMAAFSAHTIALLQSPKDRAVLGASGQANVRAQFSAQSFADRVATDVEAVSAKMLSGSNVATKA